MNWEGQKLRELSNKKGFSLAAIAEQIGVTRQTVNDWIKGQIPKGNHLLELSTLFDVSPDIFFNKDISKEIAVPVYRKRRTSKITEDTQETAISLSKDYLNIFKNHENDGFVHVIRTKERNRKNAEHYSIKLREFGNIVSTTPIDYESTFILLSKLGIHVIFRTFPKRLKVYAFFTKIIDHRVVFVNNSTNLLDLIFPLLHEAIHAVRDEYTFEEGTENEKEDDFCELVAGLLQYPRDYLEFVYSTLHDIDSEKINIGIKINTLKNFARNYKHSIYGLVKAIKLYHLDFELDIEASKTNLKNIGAADTNLRKEFPTIGDLLYSDNSISHFIKHQKRWSPLFYSIIREQIKDISHSKLAEIYEISTLDAKDLKLEMLSEIE